MPSGRNALFSLKRGKRKLTPSRNFGEYIKNISFSLLRGWISSCKELVCDCVWVFKTCWKEGEDQGNVSQTPFYWWFAMSFWQVTTVLYALGCSPSLSQCCEEPLGIHIGCFQSPFFYHYYDSWIKENSYMFTWKLIWNQKQKVFYCKSKEPPLGNKG